ncbi:CatB-related O-acetyltransferase [Reinekea thalattae]|uniref:CatB-related O-acetyltransferase n=2 Tax=Reinekea thalattae TaxID=2593301 RepID=A0A5C8ZCQ8_9GAMM|nr:CatB-related O-acetyltransferase [Reinekea thalattae]
MQDKLQKIVGGPSLSRDQGGVVIGHGCWIGDNVTILPGVCIGNGVVIGAGSVVTGDIPSYCIAVGTPAKAIKRRFSLELIDQLEDIKWWYWPKEKLEENVEFFSIDLTSFSGDLKSMVK